MIKKTKFEARRMEWSPLSVDGSYFTLTRVSEDVYSVQMTGTLDVFENELHSLIDAINYVLGGDSPIVEQSEPPSSECTCKEESKPTVDLSKLRIGDSVRLRDGRVHIVEEIESLEDHGFYKWNINDVHYYSNDGRTFANMEGTYDIMEIIPKNPKNPKSKTAKTKVCRKGRPWTDEQDQTLMAKWNANVPAARIAQGEKRTKMAVYARIGVLRSLYGENKVPFRKEDSHGG